MLKLFISYSRDDKLWVYDLAQTLKDDPEYEVWIDRRLIGADRWWDTILDEIERADCVIVCLSPKFVNSIYCMAELNYALRLNKPIIPLLLKPCDIPQKLQDRQIQYEDISELNTVDEAYIRLGRALNRVQRRLDHGDFSTEPALPFRPPMPEPQSEAQQLNEVFSAAEEATAGSDYQTAERLFQQIVKADPASPRGKAAQRRLQEINAEQQCADEYREIERLAANPKTLRGAVALWENYGAECRGRFDPNGYASDPRFAPPILQPVEHEVEEHAKPEPAFISNREATLAVERPLILPRPAPIPAPASAPARSRPRLRPGLLLGSVIVLIFAGVVGTLAHTLIANSNLAKTLSPIAAGTIKTLPNGIKLVYVPAGCFMMGSSESDTITDPSEQPEHRVCLTKPYWLGQYELSNAEYQKFITAGGYATHAFWSEAGWQWKGNRIAPHYYADFKEPDQPRVGVSWYEAEAFAKWAGGRLPTEAEWEYAARGSKDSIYPWGDAYELGYAATNEGDSGGNSPTSAAKVGSFPKGISWINAYDMAGNVLEWCADWYDATYYRQAIQNDPTGAAQGEYRVLRGGSWDTPPAEARANDRSWGSPEFKGNYVGIRIVVDVQ